MAFTEAQPKDGETILHCGHPRGGLHWFKFGDGPVQFQRPDGSPGEAEWFAACERCFMQHGDKVVNFGRGDSVWTGNEPAIEKEES